MSLSQISEIQRGDFLLSHHQMERAFEILSHQCVNYSLSSDYFIDVDTEGALTHLPDLFADVLVLDVIVDEGVNGED